MIEITPTQKKFRKQMAKLESEGKIPDNYKPRRKGIKFTKRISIISIIFLLWNVFVVYTWIGPYIKISLFNNKIVNDTSIISSKIKSKNYILNNKEIVNYLDISKGTTTKLNSIIEKIANHNKGIIYSSDERIIDMNELNKIKDNLVTNNKTLIDLKNNYIILIDIIEDLVLNINSPNISTYQKYNEIYPNIIKETINILEYNNIQYEILESGEIRYYINN